jgi:hypothetical protein
LAFAFNKSAMGGWVMAEGRRQRATRGIAKIADIAKIAEIENQNP